MSQFDDFMATRHEPGTYNAALHRFLCEQQQSGSIYTTQRLYYNLKRLGAAAENDLSRIDRDWLHDYAEGLWLHYAPDTIRTAVGDIRHYFKWLKKRKILPRNMAKKVKPVRPNPRRHRRAKAAPEADIQTVMTALAAQLLEPELIYRDLFRVLVAADQGWGDRAVRALRDLFVLTFLYETGARAGEVVRLGSATMDTATAVRQRAYMVTLVGKTNDRDRYFTERTAELWRIWQQVRPRQCPDLAVVGWRHGRDDHAPMRSQALSLMLVRRCRQAGVPPFRAHALRHAKVKRSRRVVGLEVTRQLVDHSILDTTRGYAGFDDDELTEAAIITGLQFNIW